MSLSVIADGESTCRLEMQLIAKSRWFATGLVFNTIRLARRRINKRLRTDLNAFAKRMTIEYRDRSKSNSARAG